MVGTGTGTKEMLQVSDITQYFYCPRKVYFMRTLGIKVPARHKMDTGKEEHSREHRRVKERKTVYGFKPEEIVKVLHQLPVEAPEYRLHGRVDTVLVLQDDEVVPVDVKYSDFMEVKRNWKKQLVAYALLLETKFGKKVKRGFLYFPSKKDKIEVKISEEDKRAIIKDIEQILELIKSEKMPPVHQGNKCNYCEMRKFCA